MIATHILIGEAATSHDETLFSRSAIAEWVSGSTSRRVVSHAKCPVLVVRAR